jgi:hypothetical protein
VGRTTALIAQNNGTMCTTATIGRLQQKKTDVARVDWTKVSWKQCKKNQKNMVLADGFSFNIGNNNMQGASRA